MDTCPVCIMLTRHAINDTAAVSAQSAWDTRNREVIGAHGGSAIPPYVLHELGPRPQRPRLPEASAADRLTHLEHRVATLETAHAASAELEAAQALTHGVDAEHPQ